MVTIMAFSSLPMTLREGSTIHSPPARFFFFFFSEVEISSRTLLLLSRPGSIHTGSESRDDCGRVFPNELHVGYVPTLCPDSTVSPLRLCWVKGVFVFRCNLPPAILAE